jgi:iron complex outermembrane receptor protein
MNFTPPPPPAKKPLTLFLAAFLGIFGNGVPYAQETSSPSASSPAVSPASPSSEEVTLPTVTVSGESVVEGELSAPYAGGKVARGGRVGMLGNKDVLDTPFNQTSYTQEFIQDTQARTLTDVLYNDPSVAADNPTASGWEASTIRGFGTSNGSGAVSFNGLYGILPGSAVGIDMAERVEVLKGPSALLNGMPLGNAVGGSINLVGKRAAYGDPTAHLTFSHASRTQAGIAADVGRRFGPDQVFGIRFNGSWRDGEHSVKPTEEKFLSGALGLDYQGERFRVSLDVGQQQRDISGANRPLFLSSNLPIPDLPDHEKSYLPPWLHWNEHDTFGMVSGEWAIRDDLTAYAAYGKRKSHGAVLFLNPFLNNTAGDWDDNPTYSKSESEVTSSMVGLDWKLATGSVRHRVALNAAKIVEKNGGAQYIGAPTGTIYSNIYHPANFPSPPDPSFGPVRPSGESERSSFGIADTLSMWEDRLQITLGARRQFVANKNISTSTGLVTSKYKSDVWSPAVTVLVKLQKNIALYANYIEGLQPGTVVGETYANAGEIFPPYQSKQYEAGVKVDWNRSLMTTVSVFQIAQPNMITIPGTPLQTMALDGEQRNRGVEFNVFGQPWRHIRLTGGLMLIDAQLKKTQGGINDGNQATAVPKWQGTLGGEWDTPFLPGLTLTARVKHADKAYIEASNARHVPAWTLWDIGARYRFTTPWKQSALLRFTVNNVSNENFWTARSFGVYQSTPRTAQLSASFDF